MSDERVGDQAGARQEGQHPGSVLITLVRSLREVSGLCRHHRPMMPVSIEVRANSTAASRWRVHTARLVSRCNHSNRCNGSNGKRAKSNPVTAASFCGQGLRPARSRAQALRRGLTVVTANASGFGRVAGLDWVDWTGWTGPANLRDGPMRALPAVAWRSTAPLARYALHCSDSGCDLPARMNIRTSINRAERAGTMPG